MRWLILLLATVSAFAEITPYHWRGSVATGRAVEVLSVNGDLIAEGYDGHEVQVTATAKLDEAGPTVPVGVRTVNTDKGVTVCAVMPQSEPDNAAECAKGDVKVNFNVRVPRGVGVIGRTVNGHIEVQHLDADVEAYTVNGRIDISTSASAQARTVNGSITAALGKPFSEGAHREFSTVNGSIVLKLPARSATHVRAQTVNGRVSTAFRLRNGRADNEKLIEGAIGAGGGKLKLKTVNGSIQVDKAS